MPNDELFPSKFLITGANGFVGTALCNRLRKDGFSIRRAVRSVRAEEQETETVGVGEISSQTDWSTALEGVEHVVHLAARVHVMNDRSKDPLAEFRQVNVEGSTNLAQQAVAAGVRRFVYLSSIKVNGESTSPGRPFLADDIPKPEDPYGISKYEAEQALKAIAAQTGMELVIVRPPLVYGPGVKANFEVMMRWLTRGFPLPLGAITHNRRSLVALENLADLIVTCLEHPNAANQVFLVSDGEDLSTADLLRRLGESLESPARLFRVPTGLLRLGAILLNKPGIYQRICGSLQLDIEKTRQLLNWNPPLSIDEGLRRLIQEVR
jgi:nucleoside-diphosphate-sugar epimerase